LRRADGHANGATNEDAAAILRVERIRNREEPLLLDEYQQFTTLTDRSDRPEMSGLPFILLGLVGEVGSLLSELKKKQRDKDAYIAYHDSVIEELGDVVWYLSNAALRVGLKLSTVAHDIPGTLHGWEYQGRAGAQTFADLQAATRDFRGPLSTTTVERRLLALAAVVGRLVHNFSSLDDHANVMALRADFVGVFRVLTATADDADVSLEEAARRNVEKTLGRWPTVRSWGSSYDEGYDDDERLPAVIVMAFKEKYVEGSPYVIQQCKGINIGDRLTDNRLEPDDYRFHDVFHLAYAAILGWSPVLRALLKLKRKSRSEIDEAQDGARAILIEEGVSTWIFNHGVRNQDFRNVRSLDHTLLKSIRELVRGYEVETRPLWQWELAILEGFRIFRELRRYRGGTVTADLVAHTLTFEPHQ
jgi:NTP pyrophosphatase (non-canonical NTP hydrolase)